MSVEAPRPAVAVDTGGTFTDFVIADGRDVRIQKVPSTPDEPSRALLDGLAELGLEAGEITLGSTVATNALLERRGARTALLTTAGFEDVLEIGRQSRDRIYDLGATRPSPLVPRALRFGVRERLDERGRVVDSLTDGEIERVRSLVLAADVEAVAICLLHAYANPEHERRLRRAFGGTGVRLSLSSDVLPEFREYERTATTVANAFVDPVVEQYLGVLEDRLGEARLRVMQSNGGSVSVRLARSQPVRTILSGPAGGVVGAWEAATRSGFDRVIALDMGGTSTDVSLCPGRLLRTADTLVGGVPIRVPTLDIHTVGAGGGSIARRDPGGALRVGPESAGARPGPICYGRSGVEPTVTDANLLLGRLSAQHFLGGALRIDEEAVRPAFETLGRALGLDAIRTAEGVVRVVDATMERALRVVSLERGHDPAEFTLVAFGGAAGSHATGLARALGVPRVLVPPSAGVLSARGLLAADVVLDASRTVLRELRTVNRDALRSTFDEMEREAADRLAAEGFDPDRRRFERSVDARYVRQGFELEVDATDDLAAAFHGAHERRYGYADPSREIEIVAVRLRAIGVTPRPAVRPPPAGEPDPAAARIGDRRIVYGGEALDGGLYDRTALAAGAELEGPAIVVEYSTTTFVPPGCRCRVDEHGSLVLTWD